MPRKKTAKTKKKPRRQARKPLRDKFTLHSPEGTRLTSTSIPIDDGPPTINVVLPDEGYE